MKQNEIASRQNRVIYILLVIIGALGLAWAIWKHWYNTEEAPAPHHASTNAATWSRSLAVRPLACYPPGARA